MKMVAKSYVALDMIPAGIPIQELDLGDYVAKLVNGEAAHRGLNNFGSSRSLVD